ncbi:hypothetical protein LX36DRAFT_751648 [Colletotrichum falcatum]|nr:hypothetical protein LX36DRAFT_751648 [Colletotrichum falcatum]
MSANADLRQGADGQLYYKASNGHWYPYPASAYTNPSYESSQTCLQGPNPSQHPTRHGQPHYDDEEAEAGSFQGDPRFNEDPRKASPSTREQSEKKVLKYLEEQKNTKYGGEPRPQDNSRSRRKRSTKKHIDEILKPFGKS